MRAVIVLLVFVVASPSLAAETIIHDGDSLTRGGTRYRLDGIDAPELDQVCLDEKGEVWACGIGARDRLAEFIDKREVTCKDKGPDPVYRRGPRGRHIGECHVGGEDLSQWMVREGWALNFEPYAKGRFIALQDQARDNRRGIWKGCFSTPQDFRRGNERKSKLLGPNCLMVGDETARNFLFPDHPTMPPGCTIKGKFALRAKVTGQIGIYHMEGCRSYQRTKSPDRWFCAEEDAQAAGFRKAYTCR